MKNSLGLNKSTYTAEYISDILAEKYKIQETYEKVFNTFVLPQIELCLGKKVTKGNDNDANIAGVEIFKGEDIDNNITEIYFRYEFLRPNFKALTLHTTDKICERLSKLGYEFYITGDSYYTVYHIKGRLS